MVSWVSRDMPWVSKAAKHHHNRESWRVPDLLKMFFVLKVLGFEAMVPFVGVFLWRSIAKFEGQ